MKTVYEDEFHAGDIVLIGPREGEGDQPLGVMLAENVNGVTMAYPVALANTQSRQGIRKVRLIKRPVYPEPGQVVVVLDDKRKSILLHAYCELRGEAMEWGRKGDVLSAQECWDDCDVFKAMLVEAGFTDALLDFENRAVEDNA